MRDKIAFTVRLLALMGTFCAATGLTAKADSSDFVVNGGVLKDYNGAGGDIVIPEGVTEIDESVFEGNEAIASVVLPTTLIKIGECAFLYCTGLTNISWSASLQEIGDEAFVGFRATKVDLSGTALTKVGEQALCSPTLEEAVFPATLQTLGSHVFGCCENLKSVTFLGNAPTIDNSSEETSDNFPGGDIYVTSTQLDLPTFTMPDDADFDKYLLNVTTYVPRASTGWGVTIPGTWQGMRIEYDDVIALEMGLLHNYAFSEGFGDGLFSDWQYAEMEDYGEHFHGSGSQVPWVFEYGVDQHDNIGIPVTGCGANRIVPTITLGTATAADGLSATVLTDAELFAKFHVGEYDFEVDDDECWYDDEEAKLSYEYPLSAWPDGKVVDDRQWIVVLLKNVQIGRDGFFSPKTFTVGIEGTDLTTPVITIRPDNELPDTTRFTPSNVFGIDTVFSGGDGDCSFNPFFGLWNGGRGEGSAASVPYRFDAGDSDEEELVPIRFTVPSSGELYLKIETHYTGNNSWNLQTNDLQISGSAYGGTIRTCGKAELWNSEFYYVIITASGAGEIVLGNFSEQLIVNGIWFRPSDLAETECLATEAWYREEIKVANDINMANYRGFVVGMGLMRFGEQTTLVCYPNEGEELDHWEFINCTAPADATINNRVLTFTVSEPLYDEIADTQEPLKRIIVRPVFRLAGQGGDQSKYIVAFDANGGELDESEASREVVEGEAVGELPTPTREEYGFLGWSVEGELIDAAYVVAGNVTAVAQWKAVESEIALTEGLVAYYPFDGNANDASGNGNDGVVYGVTSTADRNGNANGAYYFGQGNYISVADDASLHGLIDFSVSAWVRVDELDNNNWASIICKGTGSVMEYGLQLRATEYHCCWYDDIIRGSVRTESSLPIGAWVHVAVSRSDGVVSAYLNGELMGVGSRYSLPSATSGALEIGRDIPGDIEYFYGAMDDLRLYNRPLSAAEVKALYNITAETPDTNPSTSGLWTVPQYNLNERPCSVSDAEVYIVDSMKWDGNPITSTYRTIAFADATDDAIPHFKDISVSFPGNLDTKAEWFVVVATGRIHIPELGIWTFSCGSDDGFEVVISGDGVSEKFSHTSDRSYWSTEHSVNFSAAGDYDVRVLMFEWGGAAALDFAVAKGSYSYFDSSAFKLVGDPASGVTMVGSTSATPTVWYVNGLTGSDSNSGTSESAPKATIQAAIDASAASDTILVAPGTYAPITSGNKSIVIRSQFGAVNTIIDGGGSARCAYLSSQTSFDAWKFFPDGADTNTVLVGFTLQGGFTDSNSSYDAGGGAFGGTLEQCIVTGNTAGYGGGCCYSKLIGCQVSNNSSADDGGGIWHCIAIDTLIYRNRADNINGTSGKAGGGAQRSQLYNCTVTDNISVRDDDSSWWGPGSAVDYSAEAYNCIIYGNKFSDGLTTYNGYSADVDSGTGEGSMLYNCCTSNPGFVDAENGDYRLAAGSPCIDAGDNSYVTSTTDLAGNARIANGTVDIGCYEYGSYPVGVNITEGLVAYYPFDGNANDASGNGNHGVVHGATLTADRFGNENGAYRFDGNDWIEVESSSSLSLLTSNMSLMTWVKIDSQSGWIPFLCKGRTARQFGLELGISGNGEIRIFVNDFNSTGNGSQVETVAPSGSITVGEWYHIAISYTGEKLVSYINGVQAASIDVSDSFAQNDDSLYIGKDPPDATEYYRGELDDIRIYNRALSAAEVKALYDGTAVTPMTPGFYRLVVSCSDFDSTTSIWNSPDKTVTLYPAELYAATCPEHTMYAFASYMWMEGGVTYNFKAGFDDRSTIVVNGETVCVLEGKSGYYGYDCQENEGSYTPIESGWYPVELRAWNREGEGGVNKDWLSGFLYNTSRDSIWRKFEDTGDGARFRAVVGDVAAPASYMVTFDLNGADGAAPTERQISEGDAIGELPTPTREGYEFLGWYTSEGVRVAEDTVVTEDMLLRAEWRYQFIFGGDGVWDDVGGGVWQSGEAPDSATNSVSMVVEGEGVLAFSWKVSCEDPVVFKDVIYRMDYLAFAIDGVEYACIYGTTDWASIAFEVTGLGRHVLEWRYVKDSGTSEGEDCGWIGDVIWISPSTITLQFDACGGEVDEIERTMCVVNPVDELPVPTWAHHDFNGWWTADGVQVEAGTRLYEDTALYAHWTLSRYVVSFYVNGGEGEADDRVVEYGDTIGELPVPTWEGREFLGWFTDAVGGEQVDAELQVTDAVSLFAHWRKYTFTVSFDANGGEVEAEDRIVEYGDTIGELPEPEYEHMEFLGWFAGEELVRADDVVTSDLVLRAKWRYAFSFTGDGEWQEIFDGCWQSSNILDGQTNSLAMVVTGPGTLRFSWKTSCEGYYVFKGYMLRQDGASLLVDGVEKAFANGVFSDWETVEIAIETVGDHNVVWSYIKDVSDSAGEDCVWIMDVVWIPLAPAIEGDDGATVKGNTESGFVITPSITKGAVEVTVPDGVAVEKVTVEVAATVETVKANGAKVKVMNGGYDIAEHLNLEAVTQGGVINLANAQVKEDVVKEALDTAKGATVSLGNTESPTLTTAETKPGLVYTLLEGATLEDMKNGDSKLGDGTKWTPTITVKGGTSAFYTIKVEK